MMTVGILDASLIVGVIVRVVLLFVVGIGLFFGRRKIMGSVKGRLRGVRRGRKRGPGLFIVRVGVVGFDHGGKISIC